MQFSKIQSKFFLHLYFKLGLSAFCLELLKFFGRVLNLGQLVSVEP